MGLLQEPILSFLELPRIEKPRSISVQHQVFQALTLSHTSDPREVSSRRQNHSERFPDQSLMYLYSIIFSKILQQDHKQDQGSTILQHISNQNRNLLRGYLV